MFKKLSLSLLWACGVSAQAEEVNIYSAREENPI